MNIKTMKKSVFHSPHLKGETTLCIWVDDSTRFLYSWPAHCEKGTLLGSLFQPKFMQMTSTGTFLMHHSIFSLSALIIHSFLLSFEVENGHHRRCLPLPTLHTES